ncbi:MAG: RDD family protein [Candidatus Microthrix sp.]|uniref:RDD family protein n=1 Tax=Candidatus Neomicrothrix sp. TaxID=2719034 RepID=UPI001B493EAE|nr:RDD family protein [Candidatus Microthrix sp.]MBP6151015.1 RDD family protein [Candidatus Microthrix sp.]MBP7987659.1 RDD family protein [Candidatus Microthrix sp.]MBP7994949.1 RDD family protein [Candidatus Microthrix sp.]
MVGQAATAGSTTCTYDEFGFETCELNGTASAFLAVAALMWFVGAWLYFAWPWSTSGQTLGMKVTKIKMVDQNNFAETVSFGRASWRFLFRWGTNCCCVGGLGSLWMLWDPDSRTWQDMAGGTHVVKLFPALPSGLPIQGFVVQPAQAPPDWQPDTQPQPGPNPTEWWK